MSHQNCQKVEKGLLQGSQIVIPPSLQTDILIQVQYIGATKELLSVGNVHVNVFGGLDCVRTAG